MWNLVRLQGEACAVGKTTETGLVAEEPQLSGGPGLQVCIDAVDAAAMEGGDPLLQGRVPHHKGADLEGGKEALDLILAGICVFCLLPRDQPAVPDGGVLPQQSGIPLLADGFLERGIERLEISLLFQQFGRGPAVGEQEGIAFF